MKQPVHVERDKAVQIAMQAAKKRGHQWIEPTHVSERGDAFHVSSNAAELGGNVLVVISRTTGQVLEFHFYNR